jgi:hypothetical protein
MDVPANAVGAGLRELRNYWKEPVEPMNVMVGDLGSRV